MGRVSDRTMLRSVVRVQSLARGSLSFCLFFLKHFFHHIFLLTDNKPLMSFFFDTHIKLITPVFFSSVFFFWHKLSFLFFFFEAGNLSRQSFLSLIETIPNHCKEVSFVGHLKYDFKVQSYTPTSSPQLSG